MRLRGLGKTALLLLWLPGQLLLPLGVKAQRRTSLPLCESNLPAAIESVTNRPEWERARWGILIQTLEGDRTLYAQAANQYFIPASNVKLLLTAAALRRLTPQFHYRTVVYGVGEAPELERLRLVGSGDPSLTTAQLQALAQNLKQQGIQRVQELAIENPYSGTPAINPTWEWADVYADYGTGASGLILNQNSVTLTLSPRQSGQRVRAVWNDAIASQQWQVENRAVTVAPGTPNAIELERVFGTPILRITGTLAADAKPDEWGLAIPNPVLYFVESWQTLLALTGITVSPTPIDMPVSPPALGRERELVAVESPPLAELLKEVNQQSNNLYAEALLQTLGGGEAGLTAVETTLTALGVDPESYVLADGSGLSRHNLVSPQAIAQTLQAMATLREGQVYRDSLAVAGVSGTLKHRFQDTPLENHLQGKTGTLSGISALSGYLDVPQYQPLVFSILLNHAHLPASEQRAAIDEILLLLSRLHVCS